MIKARISRVDDLELARDMHKLAFPIDDWVGDDHTFWVASTSRRITESSEIFGFASAIYRPDKGYVYLSRCAITKAHQGHGLQRRFIQARLAWGKAQGAVSACSYTSLKNYPSMVNLIRSGFKLYHPKIAYAGPNAHYFRIEL